MTTRHLAFTALLATLSAHATLSAQAVSLTSPAATYTQDFDALASSGTSVAWANNSTLAGWSLFNWLGNPISTYTVGNGSSTSGSFYSFGGAGNTDRALGGVGGGTYFGTPQVDWTAGYIALALSNDTGVDLAGFTLGFNGEQWRDSGNTPQAMWFEYGFGSTFVDVASWTAPGGSFDFTSPVATGLSGAVNGNAAGLVTGLGGTVSTSWAAGNTLWLRWVETNEFGSDHGLAIDNLSVSVNSVTTVPEPGTWALMLVGLLGVAGRGLIVRRRV